MLWFSVILIFIIIIGISEMYFAVIKYQLLWHKSIKIPSLGQWGTIYQFNSSHPGQNGHHFAEYIFKPIFMNEKLFILIQT